MNSVVNVDCTTATYYLKELEKCANWRKYSFLEEPNTLKSHRPTANGLFPLRTCPQT